ncbi:MAG: NUDIX domain-containing protein [Lentisphaeria bacterium]|nr:NUDIX domain-containing protein [Lentisphaeria bacterium]
MNLEEAVAFLESQVGDPNLGLPDQVFHLVSRLTPLVNVDLLIMDQDGRILLTWREDNDFRPGWHFPGGIIRVRETAAQRLAKVASLELKTMVKAEETALQVTEFHYPDLPSRHHFISLLYRCRLLAPPGIAPYAGGVPQPGQYAWFAEPPPDLLEPHWKYQKHWRRRGAGD